MFESFENLSEEKRNRIIDVCIEEFAEHGYKKGSTNEITKKAGISKGILFHYFKNKKNLYLYIVDHVMNNFSKTLFNQIENMNSDDIFNVIKNVTLMKMKVFSQSPIVYEFMVNAFLSPPEEIEEDIKNRYFQIYNESFRILIQKLDTTNLKKDINEKKAIELLFIALDAIANKYIKEYKGREKDIIEEADKIIKEFDQYMYILKWGFYDKA